jgi:protease I
MNLRGRTLGIIAGPGFDDVQVVKTAQILRQRGARVVVVGVGESDAVAIAGRQGSLLKPDIVLGAVHANVLDAVIVPGGDSVTRLCSDERVLTLLLEMSSRNKPIGAICNGPAILAAAGLVSGMRVTGDAGTKGELEEAGAIFLNQGVVVDHDLVTARAEDDIPHFVDAVSFLLEPAPSLR